MAQTDLVPPCNERPLLWTRLFLRRPVLVVFNALFTSLMILLAVLFFLSSRDQRIAPVNNPKLHYLWVYGPTAIFTVIAALWAPVDYWTKQLIPWVLMARGSVPAETSLLVDYISPLNLVSLYRSLRRKHWMVFYAVSGTLVLQFAIVISSSLFISAQVTIHHQNDKFLRRIHSRRKSSLR
ncbi:hypothetical protein QBC38DRAFT_427129 [Podospora fimiseda]|uniref:Uncharacterized protein n=1 Tax=Podospora fimiseda TaxID=252190 RepID=A0AAN6YRE5_9PEZI|nr:hypothetical protein QBC38DRAFT_427129 [Podospora fimiseda]